MSDYIKYHSIRCRFDNSESWVILSEIEQRIKAKIEAVGTPLKDYNPQNEISKITKRNVQKK